MSLLLVVAILLAIVDAWITYERLQLHPSLELNLLVRWLAIKAGAIVASLLGVLLVQSLVASLLATSLQSPVPLAVLVGSSLYRTYTQALSLRHF